MTEEKHLAVVCPQPLGLGWQVLDKREQSGLFQVQTIADALLESDSLASARSVLCG